MERPPIKPEPALVLVEYRALFKYLRDRYAHTVVLTFSQIEDLLNSALPPAARELATWWTDVAEDGAPSAQAHTWIQAGRTALANVRAGTVRFERAST